MMYIFMKVASKQSGQHICFSFSAKYMGLDTRKLVLGGLQTKAQTSLHIRTN